MSSSNFISLLVIIPINLWLLSTIGNSGRVEPLTIIGPEGITEVVNGLRVIAQYLPYEVNIIENPKEVNLNVGKENLEVVRKFIEKLGKDFLALFDSLWTIGDDERLETLMNLKKGVSKCIKKN